MRAKFTCNKCNHGDCTLSIEDNDSGQLDTPSICPYGKEQPTNWKLGA